MTITRKLGGPCDRCGADTGATIMSKFNHDILCMACKADEQLAPNYARAEEAEHDAVLSLIRAGQPANFPGIGLVAEDERFLAARRAGRRFAYVAAVRAYAAAHYARGWDTIVECWSDEDIAREIADCDTIARAIARMAEIVSLYREQEDNVMCQSGEHVKCPRCGHWTHLDQPACDCPS